MGGKASRDKGQRYEREIAKRYRAILGPNIRRGLQSRGGGAEEADVCGADMPDWLHNECQHAARPNPWAKLRQAERDAPDKMIRVAVVKKQGGEELVCMRWDTWLVVLAFYLAEKS